MLRRAACLQKGEPPMTIKPLTPYRLPDLRVLAEKVQSLEQWRSATKADLKEIREIISQVKLLMTLSIGGGGLSILTLMVTLILLISGGK
jgi:hypothetical protein